MWVGEEGKEGDRPGYSSVSVRSLMAVRIFLIGFLVTHYRDRTFARLVDLRGRGGNDEREREREGHTISLVLSNRVLVSFEFSSVKERELSRNDFQEILKHAEKFSAHSSSVVCLLFVDYSEKRVAY